MFVILQPHSNTNPTDKYQVVEYKNWNAFRSGDANALRVYSSHTEHPQAEASRAWLGMNNRETPAGTWSVWTLVHGADTDTGTRGRVEALVTSGLTEKQARDVAEHLRTYHSDYNVKAEQD